LKEAGRPAKEEWEVAVVAALRLLKTGPSKEASSSSEAMSTTPLPLSIGGGGGEALTVANGITAMGAGEARAGVVWVEAGARVVWLEGGAGVVWVTGGAGGAETPVVAAAS